SDPARDVAESQGMASGPKFTVRSKGSKLSSSLLRAPIDLPPALSTGSNVLTLIVCLRSSLVSLSCPRRYALRGVCWLCPGPYPASWASAHVGAEADLADWHKHPRWWTPASVATARHPHPATCLLREKPSSTWHSRLVS